MGARGDELASAPAEAARIAAGYLSFSGFADRAEHRSYGLWHRHDHMPEMLALPGFARGGRWVAAPACQRVRIAEPGPFAASQYLTAYLLEEPVEAVLERFAERGRELRQAGRSRRPGRQAMRGAFSLVAARASERAGVSAAALPFRPHRGVFAWVADPRGPARGTGPGAGCEPAWLPALLEVEGVAGVLCFEASPRLARLGAPENAPAGRQVRLCYLDRDPVETAAALRAALARDPVSGGLEGALLAGPFQSIESDAFDWFDAAP